jgi:hypothetical protein
MSPFLAGVQSREDMFVPQTITSFFNPPSGPLGIINVFRHADLAKEYMVGAVGVVSRGTHRRHCIFRRGTMYKSDRLACDW